MLLRPPQLCSCLLNPAVVLLCSTRKGGGLDQRLKNEQSSARGHTLVRLVTEASAVVRGIVPHEGGRGGGRSATQSFRSCAGIARREGKIGERVWAGYREGRERTRRGVGDPAARRRTRGRLARCRRRNSLIIKSIYDVMIMANDCFCVRSHCSYLNSA